MAANINAVTFKLDCFGNAANVLAGFKHDRLDIRPPQKFEGRSQTGRSGTNDKGCFFAHGTFRILTRLNSCFL